MTLQNNCASHNGTQKQTREECLAVRITPSDFRERARHYRLAAAVSDLPREVAFFEELATMFDRIALDFDRALSQYSDFRRAGNRTGQPTRAGSRWAVWPVVR